MNALTSTRPDRVCWRLKSHGFGALWRRQRYRYTWVWAFTIAAFGSIAPEAIATSVPSTNTPAPSSEVVAGNGFDALPLLISQATPSQVLRVGDSGDAVMTLQENLAAAGYYNGPITGYFGEQTEQAVIEFQISNGLTADGIVGAGTLAALVGAQGTSAYVEATPGNVREGTTGELVVALQERLSDLGYYAGGIDGVFGKATTEAVLQFQANNGLAADGVVGPATEEALRSPSAVSAGAAASTPTPSSPSAPETPTAIAPDSNPEVLQLGDSGRDVVTVQGQLQALGYYADPIDGEFGQSTKDAVTQFQEAQGLVADGLVGPQTAYLLDEQFFAVRPQAPAAPSPTVQPSPTPSPSATNPTSVEPAAPFPGTVPQSTPSPSTPSAPVSVPTTPTVRNPEPPTLPPAAVTPLPSPSPSPAPATTQRTESDLDERSIIEAQAEYELSPTDIVR